MFGARLKRARSLAGLSQQQLGDKAGVSKMAISKYERDVNMPSSGVLIALAEELGVSPDYFFRRSEVDLERLSFRKHRKLPKKLEDRVLAGVRDQLESWMQLAEVLPEAWDEKFERPVGLPPSVSTMDEIEAVADAVRSAWNLGSDPIPNLIEALERRGIKVLASNLVPAPDFDGLAASTDGHRVVVINATSPGDRQRFTIAHELGHLILEDRLSPDIDEEKACHRFAGAFLVPRQRALEALGQRRTWLEPLELQYLKQQWGLSIQAWVYRATDLGVLDRAGSKKLWKLINDEGWRVEEPGSPYPQEQPSRFKRLVLRALAEGLVTESLAAELLGCSVSDLRADRAMEGRKDDASR